MVIVRKLRPVSRRVGIIQDQVFGSVDELTQPIPSLIRYIPGIHSVVCKVTLFIGTQGICKVYQWYLKGPFYIYEGGYESLAR